MRAGCLGERVDMGKGRCGEIGRGKGRCGEIGRGKV